MKNKRKQRLPLIITLSIIGVSIAGAGVFAVVKHLNNDSETTKKRRKTVEETDISNNEYLKDIEFPDVEAYFAERAEIVSVTSAKTSKNVLSEQEAVKMLRERGFTEYPVSSYYTIKGDYEEIDSVSEDSSALHPMYSTYYLSSDNVYWVISLIDDRLIASPSSYNLGHMDRVPIEVSETKEIVSYDFSTNSFYLTIPYESAMEVRVVDKIDAETLDSMKLEN